MKKDEIIKLEDDLISKGSDLHSMYEGIERMFFMDTTAAGVQARATQDPGDVKLTISPSVRNNVVGVVRLLTTNEPHFKAHSKSSPDGKMSEIEDLCKAMWLESCKAKVAEIHVDGVRSAAIYSDIHLKTENVDDLLETAGDDEKDRLTDLRQHTTHLFECMPPMEDYPYFGRYGIRGMLRRYQMTGDDIKATWAKAPEDLAEGEYHFIRDWIDTKDRLVRIEGRNDEPFQEGPHDMKELNIAVQLSDGSDLWREPHKQRQPFLYAIYKGNIWRRENAVLTELFTAANERGVGVLLGFEEAPASGEIKVKNAGPGVRYIEVKGAKVLSDSAFDPALIQLLEQVLRPLTEQSTIFPQTLGSSQGMGDAPFSSLAMLSQSGQLPTVPVRKSVTNVIAHIMLVALRQIKDKGMSLDGITDLTPDDIPDDLTLDVTLEIKLPQDMFKNVQIAETAVGMNLASKEWVRENLMQISDSKEMLKAIWKEQASEMAYKFMGDQFMQKWQMMVQAEQVPPGAPTETVPGETPPVEGEMPVTAETPMPGAEGAPGMQSGVSRPGGPAAAAAGGGSVEATVPMGSRMRKPRPPRGGQGGY